MTEERKWNYNTDYNVYWRMFIGIDGLPVVAIAESEDNNTNTQIAFSIRFQNFDETVKELHEVLKGLKETKKSLP